MMRWGTALVLATLAACWPQAPADMQPLGLNCSRKSGIADHVPEFLRSIPSSGRLTGTTQLEMRVVLQLNNLDELNAALTAMTTPGDPRFGHAMTPKDFAERHLPTRAQANSAIASLRRAGLHVDDRPVGALLRASGTADQVERAFRTAIVGDSKGGGYRPDGEPRMPDEAIRGVQGLGEHQPPRQWAGEQRGSTEPPLRPQDIRRAYGVPDGLTGRGQYLAIVGLDGFVDSDLAAFATQHNVRAVPVHRQLVNGFDGKPRSPTGQTETTMDLQLLGAVAPDAEAIWAVLAAQNDPHGLLDGLNLVANPPEGMPHVRHVSVSWGVPEVGLSQAAIQVEATVLKQLSATGTTVYVASGDLGAFDLGTNQRVVDAPASQPWAAAVGGTSLRLGPPRTETTWSGSGGGYSCFWPAPHWQGMAWGQPSHEVMRALPDVSLAADPATPYAALVNGRGIAVGGTSAAAPVMAAMAALIAQSRADTGKSELGFLPPLLYSASCQLPAAGFNDIVVGSNSSDAGSGGFDSAKGFDAASGLGSVNLTELIRQLSCLP